MMAYEGQQTIDEERARKRAEIGLSPVRPTARATLQRPPDEMSTGGCLWLPVWLLGGVVVVTLLLLTAMLLGSPTSWPQVRENLISWWPSRITLVDTTAAKPEIRAADDYQLLAADQFDQQQGLLAYNQQDGQWDMVYRPSESVYHMQIWPNRLGWSTFGAGVLHNVRVEASFQVTDVLPDGYAGLLARYQNRDNFYLLGVDGRGRYQVQLLQDGQLQTLIPWMEAGWVNLAGMPNEVAFEDDGATLRMFVNQRPVFEDRQPRLPVGDAGVFGAAMPQSAAEINVDWLRLYERSQPSE